MNDSTTPSSTPSPRKRLKIFLWLAAATLLLLAWFCWQLFGPNPPLRISKETTFITTPLGPDGLPDYFEYLRRISRRDVTPENNAAVLIWQALGPKGVPVDQREEFFSEMGMHVPPEEGDYFRAPHDRELLDAGVHWLTDLNWVPPESRWFDEPDDSDESGDIGSEVGENSADAAQLEDYQIRERREEWFERQIQFAMERPWSTEQLPPLADWLKANRLSLDFAVKASRRPKFYGSFVRDRTDQGPPILRAHFYTEHEMRYLARALAIRAMWNLGEGRLASADEDVWACHNLARLTLQSHDSISQLIAQSINAIAIRTSSAFASRLSESPELCAEARRKFDQLPPSSNVRRAIVLDERLQVLDSTLFVMRQLNSNEELTQLRESQPSGARASFDWEKIFSRLNRLFDTIDEAAATGDIGSAEAQSMLEEVYDFGPDKPDWKTKFASFFSRRIRTDMLYRDVAGLQAPILVPFGNEKRHASYQDLVRIAFSLASYRAEHGEYPESLDELRPHYLTSIPLDRDSKQPLRYERRPSGYLLYAVGPDGTDNGGDDLFATSVVDGEWTNDKTNFSAADFNYDFVIRVPVPPVEKPDVRK